MIVGRCCERLGRFSEGSAVVERAIAGSTPMSESHGMTSEAMLSA